MINERRTDSKIRIWIFSILQINIGLLSYWIITQIQNLLIGPNTALSVLTAIIGIFIYGSIIMHGHQRVCARVQLMIKHQLINH